MPPSRGLTVRVCIIYQLCLAKLPRANAVHTLKHPAKIGVVVKTDRPGHIIDRYMAHSQHRAGFTETQLVDHILVGGAAFVQPPGQGAD